MQHSNSQVTAAIILAAAIVAASVIIAFSLRWQAISVSGVNGALVPLVVDTWD